MDLFRGKHERGFSSFCHCLSAKTAEGLDYPSKFSLRLQLYSVTMHEYYFLVLTSLSRGLNQPPVDLRNQRPMSQDSLSYEQQKSSFVENYALRNMLELSSKLGEYMYELLASSSFFFLHFCLFYCWTVPLFFFFFFFYSSICFICL